MWDKDLQGAQLGALWYPRGVWCGWVGGRFKREGIYVYIQLIHVVVQQKPTQHCKTIMLQFKKRSTFLTVVQSLSHVWLSWDYMDSSSPGSSVHVISQARILELVAISFFRGSSWPRDQTHISCIAGGPLGHQGNAYIPYAYRYVDIRKLNFCLHTDPVP